MIVTDLVMDFSHKLFWHLKFEAIPFTGDVKLLHQLGVRIVASMLPLGFP